MMHIKQEQILSFWFGDDPLLVLDRSDTWFGKNPDFDSAIRERFLPMIDEAASGAFDDWARTPRGALALVILLDQFPRNIFRDDARAFANDAHARRITEMALAHGFDEELTLLERCFLYLPLEHSEDLAAQERAVELYADLNREAHEEEQKVIKESLDYALRHRDIIAKFGRFPHRNAVIGRDSSTAELEFLRTPNSSF